MKRILKITGILLGIILFLGLAYMIKAQYEIKSMHPMETQEVMEGVFALQDSFCNMYLVKDGEEYIAIDAGNDLQKIKSEIERLNIDSKNVKAVLLTHSDADHTAALSLFENAKIYLSTQEEALLNGETSRFLFFGNSIEVEGYTLLDDQTEFSIGNTQIKCFLVPGHTPGSMCYRINDQYLFVGDCMGIANKTIIPFNSFFNMDTEQATKSMDIIQNIQNVAIIFTAHHGLMRLSSDKQ